MTQTDNSGDDDRTHPEDGIQAAFDWSTIDPSTAIVQTVAIAENKQPEALTPLAEAIDPDAINRIIGDNMPNEASDEKTLSFMYLDYEITIRSSGRIKVTSNTHEDHES